MNVNRIAAPFRSISSFAKAPSIRVQASRGLHTLFSKALMPIIGRRYWGAKMPRRLHTEALPSLPVHQTGGKEEVKIVGKIGEKELGIIGEHTKQVILSKGRFATSWVIDLLKKNGKHIERLVLDQFHIFDEDFEQLIKDLPLRRLEILNCERLTAKSVRLIVDTKKEIHTLVIKNWSAIDRETLLYATTMKSLKEVIFIDCIYPNLSDVWDITSVNPDIVFYVAK